ncbi:Rrf2 family transcriptional regulator [bacterium]|nr:Rrf2 family transcriptional regulator [bacterium]
MKFSQSLDLALHALMFMAGQSKGEPVMIKDLAKAMVASESYLARVMLRLSKEGLLKSIRGKRGGFTFRIPPQEITIADVVLAIDTDAGIFECLGDERECEFGSFCAVVELFQEAREAMLSVLRKMTIDEMVNMKKQTEEGMAFFIPKEEVKPLSEESSNS